MKQRHTETRIAALLLFVAVVTKGELVLSAPASAELHHRVATKRGPIHVYRPAGIRSTFTVVYVHGFYDNADSAWKDHELALKFARSHLAATFVVPEAPTSSQEQVTWSDLDDLLSAVREAKPKALPKGGPVVLVGHSAAYRTIVGWLKHPRVSEIFLVDSLYGFEDDYAAWLTSNEDRRLVLAVKTTDQWVGPFIKRFRFGIKINEIPSAPTSRLRHTRLLTMKSQYEHMDLVRHPDPLTAILRLSRYGPVTKKTKAASAVTAGK